MSTSPEAASGASATEALRQEAERGWAESTRREARGRRRTQARAGRRQVAQEREAEINRLKGRLEQAEREPKRRRQPGRRAKKAPPGA